MGMLIAREKVEERQPFNAIERRDRSIAFHRQYRAVPHSRQHGAGVVRIQICQICESPCQLHLQLEFKEIERPRDGLVDFG